VQVKRSMLGPFALITLFLLQSTSPLLHPVEVDSSEMESDGGIEWVQFDLVDGVYSDAVGYSDHSPASENREVIAKSRIGTFDVTGFQLDRPVPEEWMLPRLDLSLILISNELLMMDVRTSLDDLPGLAVREFIAPSGLLVQGTPFALTTLSSIDGIMAQHPVPLALLIDDSVLDVLMLEGGEEALQGASMRIEGWRNDEGPMDSIQLIDAVGSELVQKVAEIIPLAFSESHQWDSGRFQGILSTDDLIGIVAQPSLRTFRFEPSFSTDNSQARTHMKSSQMTSYFTTDLDGSGQIAAVADSGLDADHGDFGTRVVGNYDVIGDGSTADKHSGHGTHVACTVLGDGSQGGYSGVATSTELYFQAMENDNTGNFQSPSLNYLLNSAYSAGAFTHTNSWGSSLESDQGKYTSESEDVDDRANYYDRYYNGHSGLTILFAAGNDGPDTGTVGAPSTAKNSITVGNHQNRYSGAPDSIMSGSSRGPTDDGRIKPDILAPGGYVRSCRAQEATDTGGSTWSNSYYLEYTGTSMATPNTAGAAIMVREYLEEIALRPSPQGALVKALLILGAQDIGTRDIPNDDEGWGRLDLRNTLAPTSGQGIWVDDRSVLSGTGNSKTYSFNISQANSGFKTVLVWSDERGSPFSNTQLVNNLDIEVTTPSGEVYLGNDFSNGRSTTGGSADNLNNVEVVLVDNAELGVWTVKVKDAYHGGSKAQPFAIAVMGHGVNDLRPDPSVLGEEFAMSVTIPQVGDQLQVTSKVFNFGNVRADFFDVTFEVDGVVIDTKTIDLGAGSSKTQIWYWTPQIAGQSVLSFIIDPSDEIDEILENNNRHDVFVNVTAPGVKLSAEPQTLMLLNTSQSITSWNVTLTNTALVSTNASLLTQNVMNDGNGQTESWYVGANESNFTLDGQGSAEIVVTLVHPTPPAPGMYRIDLLGIDVDNGVSYPYMLYLEVPDLPKLRLEYDYQIVPVSPSEPTSIDIRLFNIGNANIGYDLFLEAPAGWDAGFDTLSSIPGASSGSTGLISKDTHRVIGMSFTPPQVMTAAGAERMVRLTAISQTEITESWVFDIPIKVTTVKNVDVNLETNIGVLRPDSYFSALFSLQHRGNIDLSFTPSFELPSGWTVTSGIEPFDLTWASSKNLLFGISGDGTGTSGEVKFHLDSDSERITWAGEFNVEVLAQPTLSFVSLDYEDGTSWDTSFGEGTHPTGVPMLFTWLVGNEANVEWEPIASLALSNGLFGECSIVEPIGPGDIEPVSCTIIISPSLAPLSQPSFALKLNGGGVEYTENVGLLVATVLESSWVQERTTSFTTGNQEELEVTLLNAGNIAFSHKLVIEESKDWTATIDGNDIANLEPGESMSIRLLVRADRPGDGILTLGLQGADSVTNASIELQVTSEGEPMGTSGQTLPVGGMVFGVLLIAILIGAVLFSQRRKQEPSQLHLAPPMSIMPNFVHPIQPIAPVPQPVVPILSEQTQQEGPMCWSCRDEITGLMLGCPGCGARYHRADFVTCTSASLTQCVNCETQVSSFVEA
jgi:serine protease AprX